MIIPAYNAQRFLRRAVQSALGQTYPHVEILVVDDGSTDGTADVIRSFTDARLRPLAQPNRGQGAARNLAIRASTGRYVTFLDADDVYLPWKVERQVEFLTSHPDCDIVFCEAFHFFSGRPHRLLVRRSRPQPGDVLRELLRASFINPNTLMIPADIMRGGLLFREERYYPEEWDLCIRLARAGHRFGHQPEELVIVEIREGSNTTMAAQFPLKRHTLEMFERLFAEMPDAERAAYGAAVVLRSSRRKLVWASLVSADPVGSFDAASSGLPRGVAGILRGVVRIVPAGVVRRVVAAAWRFRQRLSFAPLDPAAVEQAWRSVHGRIQPQTP